jgi:hypothetical protein
VDPKRIIRKKMESQGGGEAQGVADQKKNSDKKLIGLRFGRLFHKLIWSPWYLHALCRAKFNLAFFLKYFWWQCLHFPIIIYLNKNFIFARSVFFREPLSVCEVAEEAA